MNAITLRLPDDLDRVLRQQIGVEADAIITDSMRRIYVASLLAALMDGLASPTVAEGIVRLNGGRLLRSGTGVH